jgi:hypothetical protein
MEAADGVRVMELIVCVGGLDTDSDPDPDPDPQATRNAATVMTSDRITTLLISSLLHIGASPELTEFVMAVRPEINPNGLALYEHYIGPMTSRMAKYFLHRLLRTLQFCQPFGYQSP